MITRPGRHNRLILKRLSSLYMPLDRQVVWSANRFSASYAGRSLEKVVERVENGRLIFVSHSGDDTWVAKQLAREISARGATPFLDEADVDVGAEFEDAILEFLDKADALIVLFTPWSFDRPYVWAEIGAAWIRKIPIVVILYGITRAEFQSQPNAPVFLKKRDIILLNGVDAYFDQLGQRAAGANQ